MSGVRALIRSN